MIGVGDGDRVLLRCCTWCPALPERKEGQERISSLTMRTRVQHLEQDNARQAPYQIFPHCSRIVDAGKVKGLIKIRLENRWCKTVTGQSCPHPSAVSTWK